MPEPELPNLPLELLPVPGRDRWYQTPIGEGKQLQALVLQLQDSNQLAAWQIVCGMHGYDGHRIFAISGVSAVKLAREFCTGSHQVYTTPESEKVCEQLAKVYEVAPFRPYFVDCAGYKCRFIQPISRPQSLAVEKILTVGLEGYVSEWSGHGPILADAVLAENGLRLWWD